MMAFVTLVKDSFTAPSTVAARIVNLRLDPVSSIATLCVSTIFAVFMLSLSSGFGPVSLTPELPELGALVLAAVMFGVNFALVLSLVVAGRMLGGTGQFQDGIPLMAWIQVLQILLSVAQAVLFVLTPILAAFAALAAFGVISWILFSFINLWHGFGSMLKALACFGIGLIGLAFAMSVLAVILGIQPVEVPQ